MAEGNRSRSRGPQHARFWRDGVEQRPKKIPKRWTSQVGFVLLASPSTTTRMGIAQSAIGFLHPPPVPYSYCPGENRFCRCSLQSHRLHWIVGAATAYARLHMSALLVFMPRPAIVTGPHSQAFRPRFLPLSPPAVRTRRISLQPKLCGPIASLHLEQE